MKNLFIITAMVLAFTSCSIEDRNDTPNFHQMTSLDGTKLDLNMITARYVESLRLFSDDGTYTKGPIFKIDTLCWTCTYKKTSTKDGVAVTDYYSYYIPLGQSSVIFRTNTYYGDGIRGGHIVVLKDDSKSTQDIGVSEPYDKLLVQDKKDDLFAMAFERYCILNREDLIFKSEAIPNIATISGRRKREMLETRTNLLDASIALNDTSKIFQSQLENIMEAEVLDAYRAERKSFIEWYKHQSVIAEKAIPDIIELLRPGSITAFNQALHVFDISNTDLSEQTILYRALAEDASFCCPVKKTTFKDIDSAKTALKDSLYAHRDNNFDRPDSSTPQQLVRILDKDITLFKKWMVNRNVLEQCLNPDLRNLYAAHTAYWKYLYWKHSQYDPFSLDRQTE